MRCQLCGTEAARIRATEGELYHCRRCGEHIIGLHLAREVLRPHAERLATAAMTLRAAGCPRIELRDAADIERVLQHAESLRQEPTVGR